MRTIFNAGLFALLSSAAAFASTTGAGAVVPIVVPLSLLGGALGDPVAASCFLGGVAMIGTDLWQNHEMSRLAQKGMVTIGAGAFALGAGSWMSLYGVTGALI